MLAEQEASVPTVLESACARVLLKNRTPGKTGNGAEPSNDDDILTSISAQLSPLRAANQQACCNDEFTT
jgi:hypothetical protein